MYDIAEPLGVIMILSLAIAVNFFFIPPTSTQPTDKFAVDKELIARADSDRKATSQPVATKKPKTVNQSDLNIEEIKEFRRDQVTVQEGWVSYPKDWKTIVTKREKYKDGVIFEGPLKTEEGKRKQVVIYDVNDLLCEVPDFESQMFSDEESVEIHDNCDGIVWAGKIAPQLSKKEKRSAKARELENLIKEMFCDGEKVKVVDP